ncbi:MAG: ABC transporter permease, partial [Candidatus Aminicenantes bacterium]
MNPHKDALPLLGKALLWFFLEDDDYYQAIGDFEEAYRERAKTQGSARAKLWFWFLLFKSLPGFIIDYVYWRVVMLKNYFKVALRNIRRHKGFSFINITGLAIGMACCILIMLWVQDELRYDKY